MKNNFSEDVELFLIGELELRFYVSLDNLLCMNNVK